VKGFKEWLLKKIRTLNFCKNILVCKASADTQQYYLQKKFTPIIA